MGKLTFIIGTPGSGKTSLMLGKIRVLAEAGKKISLIVPEQYSSTAERRTYDALGISLFNRIDVGTFSRMRRAVSMLDGGLSGTVPDDAAKTAVMYAVRRELSASELKFYGNQIRNPAFVPSCIRMVRELELNGISHKNLISDKISDSALSGKMSDIALICGAYELKLSESGYVGALSNGREIAEKAAANGFFMGKYIFIDQFKSFTADERMLIEIMRTQAELFVCMPTPFDRPNDSAVYAAVNETIDRICGGDYSDVGFITPDADAGRFSAAKGIGELSKKILSGEFYGSGSVESTNIHVYEANSVDAEADYVCAEISRMVRSGKYHCEDIAVLSRCFEDIRPVLTDSLIKYEIPFFADIPRPASMKPLMIFVMTLLEAASSEKPDTEAVLRLLKTFMTSIEEKYISELENFYIEYGITNEAYDSEQFSGYDYGKLKEYDSLTEEEKSENAEKYPPELYENVSFRAAAIRREVMSPIAEFRKKCGNENTLRALSDDLADLIVQLHTDEIIANEISSDNEESREQLRLYRMLGEMLTRLGEAALPERDNTFTIKEFRDILGIMISGTKISSPAHSLSSVTVSSSDRARPDAPKVVFIMSAVNGMFPFRVSESGIFSEKELEIIEEELDLKFAANIRSVSCEENFIAVNSVAAPSEELYITYPLSGISGNPLYPSALTDEICRLTGQRPEKISHLPREFFMTTAGSAFSEFLADPSGKGQLTPEKIAAVKNIYDEEIGGRMVRAAKYRDSVRSGEIFRQRIEPENALRLFAPKRGKYHTLDISASGLESYAKCPFMFFCGRGLKLRIPQKPDYSANIRGNAVHGVLKELMTEIRKNADDSGISFGEYLLNITNEILSEKITKLLEKFYHENYTEKGIVLSPSFEKILMKQKDTLLEMMKHMRAEFSPENSRFEPREFEYHLRYILDSFTENGERFNINFRGDADRVDTFRDDSSGVPEYYLRVADYKTGEKQFAMRDILYGMNMQMLLYLFAITNSMNTDGKDKNYEPAGVLYVPSKIPLPSSGERFRGNAEEISQKMTDDNFRMNGITLNEPNIIRAMEYDANGIFITQRLNTANFRTSFNKLCVSVRKPGGGLPAFIGDAEAQVCGDMSADERDAFTAELCRIISADGSEEIIAALAEKYPEKNIPKLAEDLISGYSELKALITDTPKNKTDEKRSKNARELCSVIAELPHFLDVYRYFSQYIPSSEKARTEVEAALRKPSGKTPYPSPNDTLSAEEMKNVRDYIWEKVRSMSADICGGNADIHPLRREAPCQFCDFRNICENTVPVFSAYRNPYPADAEKAMVKAVREKGKEV